MLDRIFMNQMKEFWELMELEYLHDHYLNKVYEIVKDKFDYCIKEQDYWEKTKTGGHKQLGEFDILGYIADKDALVYIEIKSEFSYKKAEKQIMTAIENLGEYVKEFHGLPYLYSTEHKSNDISLENLLKKIDFIKEGRYKQTKLKVN